ncbi:MAG TPA: hypothetical protein VJV23_04160 [Candidatus Polarisedimenticolia bacterium]|nr:hypothetical protein [Candidatus Polarisedimenticolia bacterium]
MTLNEVADFDGAPDTDYVLSVSIRDQEIFHLDRTMIGAAALSAALPVGEAIQHSSQFFSELWRRAFLQAHKISEHVDFLNKALEKKIVPF